jgi:hypothetical protein
MDSLRDQANAWGVNEWYRRWRGLRVDDVTVDVGDQRYEVRHLRRLRVERGPVRRAVRVTLVLAAGQALLVTATLVGLVEEHGGATAEVLLLAFTDAVATAVLVGLALTRWPRTLQLWAEYRGAQVLLHENADRYEFGKVRRAVERAMLSHRLLK